MVVEFKGATVLDCFVAKSAKGRDYGKIKFLTSDLDVFEIFLSAADCPKIQGLNRKDVVNLAFTLTPGFNGGVSLVPAW